MKFEYLLVADAINLGPEGKVNALGLGWRMMNFPQLPAPLSFAVVANLSGTAADVGSYEGEFRLVLPDGTEESLLRSPVEIRPGGPRDAVMSVVLGLDVVMKPFTQEGQYTIRAKVGPVSAEYGFRVRVVPPGLSPDAEVAGRASSKRAKKVAVAP